MNALRRPFSYCHRESVLVQTRQVPHDLIVVLILQFMDHMQISLLGSSHIRVTEPTVRGR